MRERILQQLSDLPWLLAAGAIGLVIEGLLVATGVLRPAAVWIPVVEVVVLYGGVLGYLGFRFGCSGRGVAAGAGVGLLWGAAFALLAWEAWTPETGAWAGPVLRTLIGAAMPAWSDRLANPWLLRGPLGRLASQHPRYQSERSGA